MLECKEYKEWYNEVYLVEQEKMKDNKYKEFFNKMLAKYKVKSPNELDKDKRKQFYDEVDKMWKADKETD